MALSSRYTLAGPLAAFGAEGPGVAVSSLGTGNINDTYLVEDSGRRFVLQRINPAVFQDPVGVVANFARLSDHLAVAARSLGIPFLCAQPVLTRSGDLQYQDDTGGFWRAQTWIEHLPVRFITKNIETARQFGLVLARFHLLTAGLDASTLITPIPGFHRTPHYLLQFDRAAAAYQGAENPELKRALAFAKHFRWVAPLLEDGEDQGYLVQRTIHGDPKLDNVIFTKAGGAAGLFDLDTAGSGLILYDIGDCLRSSCNAAGEQGEDWRRVQFDVNCCQAVLAGYLADGEAPISDEERYRIFDAVLVITVELALRFLADYCNGNAYFKVRTPTENLYRALGQFQLAESIRRQEKMIRALTV